MHVTTPGAGQRIVGASKRLWLSIRQDSLVCLSCLQAEEDERGRSLLYTGEAEPWGRKQPARVTELPSDKVGAADHPALSPAMG